LQELAAAYRSAVFVRIHIDASPDDKALFKNTLLGRATPSFFFFRGGQLLHSHASASAAVLEQHLREHLPAREQPVQCVLTQPSQQQQQQQQKGEGVDAAVLAAALGGQEQSAVTGQQQQQQPPPKGFSMADIVYNVHD
jgi:hypothetical protein